MKIILLTFILVLPGLVLAGKPKLVNVIVIDMFPVEYLERFNDLFGEEGFRRFENEGVWYQNAQYDYGATLTGPGHATISTGRYPCDHGIVLNDWFDRRSNKTVYCVSDTSKHVIGTTRKSASPQHLLCGGMADAFEQFTKGKAKTVSISLKDRSAVLMGGKRPDAAVWFEDCGMMVTSNHYGKALPTWAKKFNSDRFADSFFKKVWERVLPDSAYNRCTADDVPWEDGAYGDLSNILPKAIGDSSATPDSSYYNALGCSPFGNELLLELAKRAVIAEKIGKDSKCDYLSISLSSPDEAGHLFGPRSHEMLDLMVRTDRQIAQWLTFLDERIGMENCLVVLTGDHGVAPCPETACNASEDCGRFKRTDFQNKLNSDLNTKFNTDSLSYVSRVQLPWIYLNDSLITTRKIDRNELIRSTETLAEQATFVTDVFTLDEAPDSLRAFAGEGYYAERCGDLYVQVKPNWLPMVKGTNHGTSNDYDRRVPLLFVGSDLKPKKVERHVGIRDLAVTVCDKAEVCEMNGATGTVLPEVKNPLLPVRMLHFTP